MYSRIKEYAEFIVQEHPVFNGHKSILKVKDVGYRVSVFFAVIRFFLSNAVNLFYNCTYQQPFNVINIPK